MKMHGYLENTTRSSVKILTSVFLYMKQHIIMFSRENNQQVIFSVEIITCNFLNIATPVIRYIIDLLNSVKCERKYFHDNCLTIVSRSSTCNKSTPNNFNNTYYQIRLLRHEKCI